MAFAVHTVAIQGSLPLLMFGLTKMTTTPFGGIGGIFHARIVHITTVVGTIKHFTNLKAVTFYSYSQTG